MGKIPEEKRASELVIESGDQPVTKALGVSWRSEEDTLSVPVPPSPAPQAITKRNVLKKIATVFDPLGFVSPVVIKGKMMLQTLWARGYVWDDLVQDDVANEIKHWFEQLSRLSDVRVPRCIRLSPTIRSMKLVTFVDASTSAFGAVVYARYEYETPCAPTSRVLASKSKVAPLVPVTVPRLELMAAVTGLRLTQAILKVLELPMSTVTFYSGSLDVIWWIRGHGRDFRPFVANRVGEIQMSSDPQQWQNVSTQQNPADMISRGISVEEIQNNALWLNGPEWLVQPEDTWPKTKIDDRPTDDKERRKLTSMVTQLLPIEDNQPTTCTTQKQEDWRLNPKRHSSWTRFVCIHARVLRVLCNMRKKKEDRELAKVLKPEEILDAEEDIIRTAQKEAFPEEYQSLKAGKPIS